MNPIRRAAHAVRFHFRLPATLRLGGLRVLLRDEQRCPRAIHRCWFSSEAQAGSWAGEGEPPAIRSPAARYGAQVALSALFKQAQAVRRASEGALGAKLAAGVGAIGVHFQVKKGRFARRGRAHDPPALSSTGGPGAALDLPARGASLAPELSWGFP